MRLVWILVLSATELAAQHLRLGVVGGTGLTSDYSTYYMPGGSVTLADGSVVHWLPVTARTGSRSPIGGPTIEWEFNNRFSLEGSAIYRRLRLENGGPTVTWEFPALLKYRLPVKPITPFIEAGPSLRTTGNRNTTPSHYGVSAGAGVDLEWRGFRISPTIRYTRWAADSTTNIASKPDQVEALLAFSHGAASDRHPFGNQFHFGVLGGFNLVTPARPQSYDFGGSLFDYTRDYRRTWLAGGQFQYDFADRWSAIGEVNYRQLRFRDTIQLHSTDQSGARRTNVYEGTSAVLWQFPVLLRYRLASGPIRPFLEAGPSFRLPQEVGAKLGTRGIAAGAGVSLGWRGLHFEPGLRFSRWGGAKYRNSDTAPNEIRRNQLDAVFAITF